MHSCVLENTVLFACAAGGLAQTAPEGLVPLDSLSSPAGGTKGWLRMNWGKFRV